MPLQPPALPSDATSHCRSPAAAAGAAAPLCESWPQALALDVRGGEAPAAAFAPQPPRRCAAACRPASSCQPARAAAQPACCVLRRAERQELSERGSLTPAAERQLASGRDGCRRTYGAEPVASAAGSALAQAGVMQARTWASAGRCGRGNHRRHEPALRRAQILSTLEGNRTEQHRRALVIRDKNGGAADRSRMRPITLYCDHDRGLAPLHDELHSAVPPVGHTAPSTHLRSPRRVPFTVPRSVQRRSPTRNRPVNVHSWPRRTARVGLQQAGFPLRGKLGSLRSPQLCRALARAVAGSLALAAPDPLPHA